MELRDFGLRNGLQVAPASIGAMRLPRDVDDAIELIRHAIDAGMRYIDTSRGYGESEWIVGRALKDGYREKVILSTKCSPWITKIRPDDEPTADRTRRRIEESMLRLDVEVLDYYQVWNIDSREHYDAAVAKGGMLEGIQRAMNEGLVRHTGFTTHDTVENLLDYIQEVDWCDIILFTYNMLNQRYAPAIQAAHEKGIGTIIMNPVAGGKLAQESRVLEDLASRVGVGSAPELAVRYVLSNPHVTTLINGITKLGDVDSTVRAAEAGPLSTDQMAMIQAFIESVDKEKQGLCTSCKYCMPCPSGINIPAIMNCIYDERHLGLAKAAKHRYQNMRQAKADACTQCGQCEEKCTQKLAIIEQLAYAAAAYAEPAP